MASKTFRTLGAEEWSDRRPLPPDSAMVGSAELLLLLNDPKRSERDNERDSGRSRCKVEDWEFPGEDDDGDSVAFLSSSVVTNLSSSAKSASLFDERFAAEDDDTPPEVAATGSTSESCNNKGWNSFRPLITIIADDNISNEVDAN